VGRVGRGAQGPHDPRDGEAGFEDGGDGIVFGSAEEDEVPLGRDLGGALDIADEWAWRQVAAFPVGGEAAHFVFPEAAFEGVGRARAEDEDEGCVEGLLDGPLQAGGLAQGRCRQERRIAPADAVEVAQAHPGVGRSGREDDAFAVDIDEDRPARLEEDGIALQRDRAEVPRADEDVVAVDDLGVDIGQAERLALLLEADPVGEAVAHEIGGPAHARRVGLARLAAEPGEGFGFGVGGEAAVSDAGELEVLHRAAEGAQHGHGLAGVFGRHDGIGGAVQDVGGEIQEIPAEGAGGLGLLDEPSQLVVASFEVGIPAPSALPGGVVGVAGDGEDAGEAAGVVYAEVP